MLRMLRFVGEKLANLALVEVGSNDPFRQLRFLYSRGRMNISDCND